MSVEAFSLLQRQLDWVKGQPKGRRSRAVRNAIDFYHDNRVEDLMAVREKLQNIVLSQSDRIDELEKARQVGGRRLLFAFISGYFLAHTFDLLEYALFG